MILRRLRDGRVVALLLVVALAVVVLLNQFAPTRSAYSATVRNDTNTAATAPYFTCTGAVGADTANALFAYRLTESTNAKTATDWSGRGVNGTYQGSMTAVTPDPNACPRDTGSAYVLNGSTSYVSTSRSYANPTTFSEEVWFKTTVAGGQLIGFGSSQTGGSGQHDRKLYLNTSGQLAFGTYSGTTQVVSSPKAYTDGAWHHAVTTMSPANGMRLYVDGTLVASNAAYKTPENYTGWFRIGYDTIGGWPGSPANAYFTGSMRYAAVYGTELSAAQVAAHAAAGR
ncbi:MULTISPECIES: LamG domain-containing protein [unclassified Curtobacterium]|uniref:LamG domain-containing protein n=1 Tax=unclassified Curtobacterium TaxID=257496 RepID=UPI00105387D8|nr:MULTISPECIES: LamG domain-containing protein [unclassified Curtobacterium]NQW90080.1 LamG domain-containing protein [Curtobacterium sp. VKM Ac-2861]TCL79759.1 concanavalin A-like lectin/glucanase superfamily protein [Curtobacterium sp. PhB128]TCL98067.1 concanavalin A-like lectin/glucanase superfamily protein [Curtobacterium sp. PhB138]TCU50018.1 concanavalin A-like lectin/glucanase superfamily protein [Curtobacterium sp. PhB146]TDW46248.1 concanavalin A-like lectin/glucanase superfamily pr